MISETNEGKKLIQNFKSNEDGMEVSATLMFQWWFKLYCFLVGVEFHDPRIDWNVVLTDKATTII